MMGPGIEAFVRESNLIEGIDDPEADRVHQAALMQLLLVETLTIDVVAAFVRQVQPMAHGHHNGLRDKVGMNVRIGNHLPPIGGPPVRRILEAILSNATQNDRNPFRVHLAYETLHPFMDGNGRSGRALWCWQMAKHRGYSFQKTFLHLWYYQSLDAGR